MDDRRDGPAILVDADACPVKAEIATVAARHGLGVTLVANGGLRPSRDPSVRIVIVGAGFDAADDWIADAAEAGDVVVTADIPLAARCVDKGALAVTPQGRILDAANAGAALAARNLSQSLREPGTISTYNAAFGAADRSRFLQALETAVRRARNMEKYRS